MWDKWRNKKSPSRFDVTDGALVAMHVIGFSDLNDLWVIKTKKSLWSFARVLRLRFLLGSLDLDQEYTKVLFILQS